MFKTNRIILAVLISILVAGCKSGDSVYSNWGVYKADSESTSYSKLTQINTENVSQLKLAWTFFPNDAASSRGANSECNPITIDGVMYLTSARHRLYAVNASTGEQIWSFDPFNGEAGGGVNRGVTYWEDGQDKRILFTAGDILYAIDAKTGLPIPSFGTEGKVSMNVGLRGDPEKISVIPTSPGIVYKNLLIMGTEVSELYGAEPGDIRAYDIKTGALVWTFHTIPHPGEYGYETWPKDAWQYVGGVNAWAGMSLDEKRGMVFAPLGSPSYDYYGADRIGENLFGNSVVALNAKTGERIWHFQTVHHDLWDYDLPAPPNLVTIERNGKKIDAVAQTSKIGFLYVLDRETGEPIFPIEERPVPASDIPGEEAWPTQPFPLKPAPYSRHFLTVDDLADYSPESRDSLVKVFNSFRYEGIFTPPSLQGSLQFPGSRGGSSWGGGAFDPTTGIIYVKSNDSPEIAKLKKVEKEENAADLTVFKQGEVLYNTFCVSCHGKDKNGNEFGVPSLVGLGNRLAEKDALNKIKRGAGEMPSFASVVAGKEQAIISFLYEKESNRSRREDSFLSEIEANKKAIAKSFGTDTLDQYLNLTAYGHFRDIEGRPGIKPPWGALNAINLNTGEYEWVVPIGNDSTLQKAGAPETGEAGSGGPIVTAGGVVFIGGTRDKKFRAVDKTSGKVLWEVTLPAVANATPSTYTVNGKQYVAISVGGDKENPAGSVMAFALP